MKWCSTTLLYGAVTVIGCISFTGASDIHGIQAEFDRCISMMERCERTLRSFEDAVGRIKRAIYDVPAVQNSKERDEATLLESRIDYYHNRFERASGLADKTRDDLNNVNGPTCPSCVISAVNLYCRSTETLQEDIDEYLQKASDLEMRLARTNRGDRASHPTYENEAAFLDSAIESGSSMLQSCKDKSVKTLWKQIVRNRSKADSLYACGLESRALQALAISRKLLQKTEEKCSGK